MCGMKLEGDEVFCPKCGAKNEGVTGGNPGGGQYQNNNQYSGSQDSQYQAGNNYQSGGQYQGNQYQGNQNFGNQNQYQNYNANNPPRKSKIAAGILGVLLGGLGVHNFYLGYTGKAVAQLIMTLTIILSPVSGLWGLIEGIMILVGSINRDAKGNPLGD